MKNGDEAPKSLASKLSEILPAEPTAAPTPIAAADPLSFIDDAPAFPAATLAALKVPVDPELVEVRQPNDLLYVPWVHYQTALFNAFGPGGYRLVPRAVARQEGNVMTWVGALFVRAPGTSKFQFIKEAKGECGMHGGMTPGNAAEGAQSDCLVKCCKGLGIFMELFDPRWRRAWQERYKPTHKAATQKAAWPAARAGAAPSAAAPSSEPSKSAASTGGSDATGAVGAASSPPTDGGTSGQPHNHPDDTGETATPEQLTAIKGELKRHAWKLGFMRIWFSERFATPPTANSQPILDCLTQENAVAAFSLLQAYGTAVYPKLLAKLQAEGMCR